MVSKNELRNLLIICPLFGVVAVLSGMLVHSQGPNSPSFLAFAGMFGMIVCAVAFLTSFVGLLTYSERKKEDACSSSQG